MKKVFIVPLIVIAAFVSQAWAECNVGTNGTTSCCWWSETSCWGIGGQYDEQKTEQDCRNSYGFPQSNCNTPNVEWCRWDTGCYKIPDNTERAKCAKDGYIYKNVPASGEGEGKKCEGGTWSGEGKGDPDQAGALGYCNWGDCIQDPNDDYSCTSGGCFEITTQKQSDDCQNKLTSQAQCPLTSLPKGSGGTPGGTPILNAHQAMGLVVATHGRALHISSDRSATVTLYTLAGQKVLSGKVSAGNKVFSLMGQNPGVYYAIVQSGSYTQTVNVVLK